MIASVGCDDRRVVALVDADVAGGVEDGSSHAGSPDLGVLGVGRGQGVVKTCLATTVMADMALGQPA